MLTILSLLILTSSALADDNLHPQVNVMVGGERVVNRTWKVRASGHLFWAPRPEDDTTLFFLYAGPKFHVAPWLSIAPQIGSVVNWTGKGDVLPLVSVWNWIDLSHFHFFLEGDVYPDFAGGTASYYGLYSVDYDRLKLVWIGAQVEQVNAIVNVGPHIGLPLGDYVWVQTNYHYGLGDGSSSLRFNLSVNL